MNNYISKIYNVKTFDGIRRPFLQVQHSNAWKKKRREEIEDTVNSIKVENAQNFELKMSIKKEL